MSHLAFLAHNSNDKVTVNAIASGLKERDVNYWLDSEQIHAGDNIPQKLEEGFNASTAFVAFIGAGGVRGIWQEKEISQAIYSAIANKKTIIPVLFNGSKPDNLPVFVQPLRAIEFRSARDPQAIDELSEAIRKSGIADPPSPVVPPVAAADGAGHNLYGAQYDKFLEEFLVFARTVDVNFLVGPAAWKPQLEWTEISRRLIAEKAKLLDTEGWFVPRALAPPVELAALLYFLQSPEEVANGVLNGLLKGLESADAKHSAERLAAILSKLKKCRQNLNPQVVLTTNHDLALDRAMLLEGLSFTRVIQDVPKRRLIVEEYSANGDGGYTKGKDKSKYDSGHPITNVSEAEVLLAEARGREFWHHVEPSDAPSNGLIGKMEFHNRKQPILYKFKGSVDLQGSCIISTDHFLACAEASQPNKLIPGEIGRSLNNSVPLFLGFYLCDVDLRLLLKTVLARLPGGVGLTKFAVSPEPVAESLDKPGGQELIRIRLGKTLQEKLNSDGYKTAYRPILDFLSDVDNQL